MEEQPAQAETPSRERVIGVLGIAFGLVLILGLVAALFSRKGQGGTAEALAAELFEGGEPPAGFELEDARKLVTGETVLRFTRSAQPAAEGGPEELVLVQYPSAKGVERLFSSGGGGRGFGDDDEDGSSREASGKLLKWEQDPSFAWHTTIARDEVTWSQWRAPYQIERAFREGGGWRDSVRVNISQPGRSLVLFGQWPETAEASVAGVRDALRAVVMLEAEQ